MANGIRTGDPRGFNKGRSSVKVPEFDKHLKKAEGHIGRNVVEIKMKTIVRKTLMIKKKLTSLLPQDAKTEQTFFSLLIVGSVRTCRVPNIAARCVSPTSKLSLLNIHTEHTTDHRSCNCRRGFYNILQRDYFY